MEDLNGKIDMIDRLSGINKRFILLMSSIDNYCEEINHISDLERSFDRSNLVASSMGQPNLVDKIVDSLKAFSDLASAASIDFQIPDYSKFCPDLASAALAGTRISDQLSLGSSLASAVSSIQIPDYSKVCPDLASAADVIKFGPGTVDISGTNGLKQDFLDSGKKMELKCRERELNVAKKPISGMFICDNLSNDIKIVQNLLIQSNRAAKIQGRDDILKYTDKFVGRESLIGLNFVIWIC